MFCGLVYLCAEHTTLFQVDMLRLDVHASNHRLLCYCVLVDRAVGGRNAREKDPWIWLCAQLRRRRVSLRIVELQTLTGPPYSFSFEQVKMPIVWRHLHFPSDCGGDRFGLGV